MSKLWKFIYFVAYCFMVYWIVSPVPFLKKVKSLWQSRKAIKESWERVRTERVSVG